MTAGVRPDDLPEWLFRATRYPYDVPARSYLFDNQQAAPLPLPADAGFEGRTPVLAIGSNRSPYQLGRKYPFEGSRRHRIPVSRAWLADHDVVFATHMSGYGAIPANLMFVPGMRVQLAVTWLDPAQLEAMHETEIHGGNYRYARLDGIALDLDHAGPDGLRRLGSVTAYVSPFGYMAHEGKPLGLVAIQSEGRPHPSATMREALDLLRQRAGHPRELHDFIREAVDDRAPATSRAMRDGLKRRLRETAIAFAHPRLTILEG
ncbi:MAG: hypothetical protein ACREFM_01355 [Hypericibacter sp.]